MFLLVVLIISLGSKYVTFPQHATGNPVSDFGHLHGNQGGWPLEQCNVVAPCRSDKPNLYLGGTFGGLGWPVMIIGSNDFLLVGGGCKMFHFLSLHPDSSGKWFNLTNIFQYLSDGRFNHQLDTAGGSEILIRVCSSLVPLIRPY